MTAKTCRSKDAAKIAYLFSASSHTLSLDKKAILEAEIDACERLFRYARSDFERGVIEKEISELRMALDLLA